MPVLRDDDEIPPLHLDAHPAIVERANLSSLLASSDEQFRRSETARRRGRVGTMKQAKGIATGYWIVTSLFALQMGFTAYA